jgi:hypothetical protein
LHAPNLCREQVDRVYACGGYVGGEAERVSIVCGDGSVIREQEKGGMMRKILTFEGHVALHEYIVVGEEAGVTVKTVDLLNENTAELYWVSLAEFIEPLLWPRESRNELGGRDLSAPVSITIETLQRDQL